MKARHYVLPVVVCALLAIVCGQCTLADTLNLTCDIDSDFLGRPGAVIKEGSAIVPPYTLSSTPLSPLRSDGTMMIQDGGVIPSGFHVSRVAASYDCVSDTLYVGLDVSNPTTDTAGGVPTGAVSRAWDADGDGNPCTVCNSMLVNPTPDCGANPPEYGLLDPQLAGNGNQDIPSRSNWPQGEFYRVYLDLNRDGITDARLMLFDNGSTMADDIGGGNVPTHRHFPSPCGQEGPIHASIFAGGTDLIIDPASNPVVDLDVVYRLQSDPDYSSHRDIEFKIGRIRNIPLSTGGENPTPYPYSDIELKTMAESHYDSSPGVTLDWRRFNFVQTANPVVACRKLVNKPKLCSLPDTVTYTLQATNNSLDGCALDITISDPELGGPWEFTDVGPGQTVTVDPPPTKTFGADFCGSSPFVNTMMVTAIAADCGTTGTASASCQTTVSPPDAPRLRVGCTAGVDKTMLCALPDTVTYTLTVKNDSETNTPVTLKLTDPLLNVNRTFTNVPQGQTRTVTVQKTFGTDFCGGEPFVNTMSVTAMAEGCVCGTTSAVTSCQATVTPAQPAVVAVSCTKTVDTPVLYTLPATVTYTLSATNNSLTDTPVTLRIVDAQLGVDQSFTAVPQNQTRSLTVQKTFGTDFAGGNPFVNTMAVTATAEGCACGTLTAAASASALVEAAGGSPKTYPDGDQVFMSEGIVTAVFGDVFYVEPSARPYGIRVEQPAHTYLRGQRLEQILGIVMTNENGERFISDVSATVAGTGGIEPVGMYGRNIGGADWFYDAGTHAGQRGVTGSSGMNNIGMLVRTWGLLTTSGRGWFYVDDGSGVRDGTGFTGIYVSAKGLTIPTEGSYVSVAGISSCEMYGGGLVNVLLPRDQADIVTLKAAP